ncbi:EamA family transporter [Emcibacter sp.]|uniref:EamA family transporter n=1 Tax=Emcibacter sp. TaxID=1979954 RepID=UPI002AA6F6EC|nr:EamA family transporter [Emcibacter sp.]
MTRPIDTLLTALAPAIWGSTFLVTTEYLPDGYPVTVSLLRALPAGLLLLLLVRKLPPRDWLGRLFILGGLNYTLFWIALFIGAYRLPGGVAATIGSVQPLMVIFLASLLLGHRIAPLAVLAALSGLGGVALLLLGPEARLDPVGIAASLTSAAAMASGTVLSRKWQPPVSMLTFTAWQLTAGGLLLIPAALILEPPLPALTAENILGLAYLGLIGAALTCFLWLRGISRMEPSAVSALAFLSPVTATLLGWAILDQSLTPLQLTGVLIILASVWFSQHLASRPSTPKTQTVKGITT